MNHAKILLLIALLSSVHMRGAAPDTVSGAIFTETREFVLVTRPPQTGQTTILTNSFLLIPGHTFICIDGGYPAKSGRWSYQKVGPDSGVLILDGHDQRLAVFDRALDFSTGSFRDGGTGILSRTFTFRPFTDRSRVANVSSRSFIRATGTATVGFVVSGEGTMVLVRAVGPGLTQFGVTDAIRAPRLRIMRSGAQVATNDSWFSGDSESIERISHFAATVGAFPLGQDSMDSALVLSLSAGAYTANVSSSNQVEAGQILIEVYILP